MSDTLVPKPLKSGALIDAEEMNRLHPQTFELAPAADRYAMKVGEGAKIGAEPGPQDRGVWRGTRERHLGAERFWTEIVAVTPTGYIGRVDNDLVLDGHGLDYNDLVAFEPRHILMVDEGEHPEVSPQQTS